MYMAIELALKCEVREGQTEREREKERVNYSVFETKRYNERRN